MSQQPIVLTLPHQLGKAEALKRLKAGFQHTDSQSAGGFVAFQNKWSGDRASILGQTTTGTVDVAEDHVRLEVKLRWLLSLLADRAKGLVQKQAKLMLEKPSNTRT